MIGWYRGEAKAIGIDGSAPGLPGWNCDAGGVPELEAPFFVRVNQVLVRLWALPSQSLTGRFGVPAMALVFRGDCCVLSESDPLARRLSLGR
jgi:hypothetical protein